MNYPIWELTTIGGGSLIALISILHVYIAHLAVGGGLFLWLTDWKGFRENNSDIHDYVKKHTWFFLLITMVFGGITGVGIWFIIALVSPAATSTLIHHFVFGWAIEWVFFIGEISALLIYHYKFDVLGRKARLNVAFLYFLFAWLSLVIINGILSFMLTPGKWLETQYFWHGFFNPSYFPSLFFRTFMALIIAGLFGYVTSVFLKEGTMRNMMIRYCTKWLLFPLPGLIIAAVWYFYALPGTVRFTNFYLNPQSTLMVNLFIVLTVLLFVIGIVMLLRASLLVLRILTFGIVVIGLLWIGGFEYIREIARKPYVINQFMYSTAQLKADTQTINQKGLLAFARWTSVQEITAENQMEAGRELFNLQCLSCHTVNGLRNDVVARSERYTHLGVLALLHGQGKVQTYMPPFAGSDQEREVLAAYITEALLDKKISTKADSFHIGVLTDQAPPFDPEKDEYILLVWNDLGMHCISDCDSWFVLLPPANTLEAQLIKRGELPELISKGVELRYQVERGFENPAAHVDFWKYAEATFGTQLEDNIGLSGNGMQGRFQYNDMRNSFIAANLPVVPYRDDGSYLPYPVFSVQAVDTESGRVLIETKVVAPVSTEMGCRNCHEGGWRVNGVAGIDEQTSTNLLYIHDRHNDTDLYRQALNGKPQLCQNCHADPALGAEGKADVLNLSAAMHGWHANYMPYDDARACVLCHPASDRGNTRCNRGLHKILGMTCTDCHGSFSEHALSLLRYEEEKAAACRLMVHLKPTQVASVDSVKSRRPWINEPDCLTCHRDFGIPEPQSNAFNVWNDNFEELYRMRTENVGIRCPACHGATHALYPAHNPFMKNRDNMQPMQYSRQPTPIGSNQTCATCHTIAMEFSVHHENMEGMFRNMSLIQ